MKLSKAQQEVMDKAKERIDYARTHSFHDWFRNNTCADYVKEMSDQEVDALIDKNGAGLDRKQGLRRKPLPNE